MFELIPRDRLRSTTSALNDRVLFAVLAAALPVPLAIALGVGYRSVVPGVEYGVVGKNVSYGVASLLVVGGVYLVLHESERAAVFRFERPEQSELTWALVGFPVGTGLYLGATVVTNAVGLTMSGYEYTLTDPATVGAIVFGAVLVSPLAEEILFRGLVLGTLLGWGISPFLAGLGAIVAFGLIHLALLGTAGVIAMCAWAIVPTALRLRYDNLSGAWVVHQLNNLWAYLGIVALGIQ